MFTTKHIEQYMYKYKYIALKLYKIKLIFKQKTISKYVLLGCKCIYKIQNFVKQIHSKIKF
jgi:hypothetical protein